MTETKKLVRKFILFVLWTSFVVFTIHGLISAGERTEFVFSGKESQTVRIEKTDNEIQILFPHRYGFN